MPILKVQPFAIMVAALIALKTGGCQQESKTGYNAEWSDLKKSVDFERFCESRELERKMLSVDTCLTYSQRSNPQSDLIRVENFVRFKGTDIPSVCYAEMIQIEGWRKRKIFAGGKFHISILKSATDREYLEIYSSLNAPPLGVFPFRKDGSLNLSPTSSELEDWSAVQNDKLQ